MAEIEKGEQQPAEGDASEKKGKPAGKPKKIKVPDTRPLPVLIDLIFTFSVSLLVLVFVAMFLVSWLTDATLRDFVLRTSIALSVLGSLLLVIFRQVSTGVLNASQAELTESLEKGQSETKGADHDAPPGFSDMPGQTQNIGNDL